MKIVGPAFRYSPMALLLGLGFAVVAEAELRLVVSGYMGDDYCAVTFSGSSEAGGAGLFTNADGSGYFGISRTWNDLGVFTDIASTAYTPGGDGLPVLSINDASRSIDRLYFDYDMPVVGTSESCDLGVGVDAAEDFGFQAGDTVSWSGEATINVGIDRFYNGTFSSALFGNIAGDEVLPLTLIVERMYALWPAQDEWVPTEYGWIWPYARNDGWIWHPEHRYQYVVGTADNMWIWDEQLGWFWTSLSEYPCLYHYDRDAWLYYYRGSAQPRVFCFLSEQSVTTPFPDYPYVTDSDLGL